MIPGVVGGFVFAAILALAVLLSRVTGGGQADRRDGEKVLEFSPLYRGLLLTLCLLGAGLIIWFGLSDRNDATKGVVGGAAMIVLILPLMVSAFRSRLHLSEEGIAVKGGLFGGFVRFRWSEITKIKNSMGMQRFVFSRNGRRAKISHQFVGLELVVEECKRRLQPAVYGTEFEKGINRLC